ncbi:MAG TPA: hypothetical protein VFW95_02105 [Candidatus Limnocylindria bacterium]|nr:hypothetical protein [Candidatus Limnocylindria bacterium]
MIGRRSLLIGPVAVVLVILLLGAGGPGPETAVVADRLVAERAAAAEAALATLAQRLQPAVDAARDGGGRVVAGGDAPGPAFLDAADLVLAATDAAVEARTACLELVAALHARDVDAAPLPPCPDPAELAAISGQLGSTAAAGDAFADVRRHAEHVAVAVDAALDALDAGDIEAAASAVAEARADHDAVVALEPKPVTLPVWIEATDEMIGAVERVIQATRERDAAAAEAAAEDFASLGNDAVTVDRALRIAIGEGGSAVTAVALERLAAALGAVEDLRAAVLARGAPA